MIGRSQAIFGEVTSLETRPCRVQLLLLPPNEVDWLIFRLELGLTSKTFSVEKSYCPMFSAAEFQIKGICCVQRAEESLSYSFAWRGERGDWNDLGISVIFKNRVKSVQDSSLKVGSRVEVEGGLKNISSRL